MCKYTNLKDTAGQSASAWSAVCTVCKRWDGDFQFEITRFESRRKAHKKGKWFKVFDVFSMVVCLWLNNKRMHKKRSPVWWKSPRFYASRVDYCEPWIFALWPSCNDIDEDFRGTDTDVMVMMKRNTMMMASMIVLIYRYILYMVNQYQRLRWWRWQWWRWWQCYWWRWWRRRVPSNWCSARQTMLLLRENHWHLRTHHWPQLLISINIIENI